MTKEKTPCVACKGTARSFYDLPCGHCNGTGSERERRKIWRRLYPDRPRKG